jgi:hypothetical protein
MKLKTQGKKEYIVLINGEATKPLTWKQMWECTTFHKKINKLIEKDIATDADCPLKPSIIEVVNAKVGA